MDDVFWLIVAVSGRGRGQGRYVNIVNDELKLLLITCLSIVTVSWHGEGGAMSRVMLSRQQTKMLFYTRLIKLFSVAKQCKLSLKRLEDTSFLRTMRWPPRDGWPHMMEFVTWDTLSDMGTWAWSLEWEKLGDASGPGRGEGDTGTWTISRLWPLCKHSL